MNIHIVITINTGDKGKKKVIEIGKAYTNKKPCRNCGHGIMTHRHGGKLGPCRRGCKTNNPCQCKEFIE